MTAIRIENLGKRFTINYQPLSRHRVGTEFWALKAINMEIEKGKVIGIIGRNGAGKSTLLNILAGISPPTMGKVEINGRVSSLLTLGAGFQEELTGRENIYLNSSILGMERGEINRKYRSIVEFSELDGFLDSPLQTYSQGMRLRLGFSIAIHIDFEILLIDEILSVGDVSFQKRCFDKIDEFRKQQKTMLITTQSLDIIERICEDAYLLEKGEVVQRGHPQKVAGRYLELLNERKLPETFQQRYDKLRWWADKRFWEKREGSKEVKIVEVELYNLHNKKANRFKTGERIIVKVNFVSEEEIKEPHFGIAIFREDGVYCYGPNTAFDGHTIHKLNKGKGFFSIDYRALILKPGKYRISTAIWDRNELWAYDYHVGCYKFEIIGENDDGQLLDLNYKWEPEVWWERLKIGGSLHIPRVEPQAKFSPAEFYPVDQDDIRASALELGSIEIVDSYNTPKNNFSLGEAIEIKLQFKFLREVQDYYLWLGLFRSDDVYCHGVLRKLKEEKVSLLYPNMPLLNGDYYLSFGIWEKGQMRPLMYTHKALVFKMSFLGQDHGTVYLEHSWKWELP